jgi:hypothetical protein
VNCSFNHLAVPLDKVLAAAAPTFGKITPPVLIAAEKR